MTAGRPWEQHADWWQREFTNGADPEYEEQIIPILLDRLATPEVVLDVGTGEGQLARLVGERTGASVVGLDPTRAQITEAARRGGPAGYILADCLGLPVRTGSVDTVIFCLVLEHVDDLDLALAETARVLRPGGQLLLFLNHPLLQTPGSGLIVDHMIDPPETYWRIGPYLPETASIEQVQKDVFIRFVHRPVSRYINTIIGLGLELSRMDEPAPPAGFVAQAREYEHEVVRTTPRLLVLEARKPSIP